MCSREEHNVCVVRPKINFDGAPGALKLGFRRDEAAAAVGSVQLLDDMQRANWITPVVNRHKLVLFDRGDIQRAWARILAGEIPPQRQRRAGKRRSQCANARGPITASPVPSSANTPIIPLLTTPSTVE